MTTRAKKRIALLVGLVALLTVGAFVASTMQRVQRGRVLDRSLAEGVAAREQGDHRLATQRLGFYLSKSRNDGAAVDPELFLTFADSRLRTPEEDNGHVGEALDAARQARDLLPGDPRPLELMLELYRRVGQVSERLQTADRLLAIEPAHYDALLAKAVSLRMLGRLDEAMATCRTLAKEHPGDLRAHEAVIELMFASEVDSAEIKRYAQEQADAHPEDVRFLLLHARVLFGSTDREAAREVAAAAAKLPIKDAETLRQLLAVLDRLDMHEEAAEAIDRRTQAAGPGAPSFAIAAERAWKAGRMDFTREYLSKAAVSPEKASDRLLGFWALIEHEADPKSEAAVATFAELRKRTAPDAARWAQLLEARAPAVDPGRARELLIGAISGEPNDPIDPMAVFYLGEVELGLGEWRQAIDRWVALLQREPRWVRLDLALGGLLLRHDRVEDAYAIATHAFGLAPDNIAVISLLARSLTALVEADLADADQTANAELFLARVHERLPDNGDAKALLARFYAATGRSDNARSLIDEIVDGKLEVSAEALRSLAIVSRRNSWGYEDRLLGLGLETQSEDPAVVFALAVAAAESGRAKEGEEMLRKAVAARQGADRVAYERRLALYLDVINHPDALAELTRLAEENPADPMIQIGLLESRSAWTDERIVTAAISRLRGLAGENSSLWRVFEARRLLTFEPSERSAAQVDLLLSVIIKSDPRAVQARELGAEASIILGARDKAIELLSQAIAADPQRLGVYPRLIELLQQAGDTERAERMLLLFADRPNIPTDLRRRRAAQLLTQGLWDLAAVDIEHLAAAGDQRDRLALAQLHRKRGDMERAKREFDALIETPGVSATALVSAADFYAGVGRMDRGREIMDMIADDPPGARDALLAGFLARQGEHSEAETIYRRHAEQRNTADAWNELARFYVRRRMLGEADAALERGLAVKADDAELLATAGVVRRMRSGGVETDTISELVQALGYSDEEPPVRSLKLAIAEYSKAPADQAAHIARLEEIVKSHHNFAPAWQLLALAHLRTGDTRRAIDAAQTAMRVLPAEPAPARLVTEVLVYAGEPQQAYAMAGEWRNRSLDNPIEPDLMMARLDAEQGRVADALRRIEPYRERIVAQAEDAPDRLELLAALLASAGRESEVREILLTRVSSNPAWAERALRIVPHFNSRPDVAREWIEAVAPALMDDPRGRIIVAQAWYDLGISMRSEADHRRVLEVIRPVFDDPESGAIAASLMAASHEQLGEVAEAEAMYRLALQRRPGFAPVMNNLAYLLLTRDGASEEALDLATRAVAAAPGQAVFIDTRATALLKLRRLDDAAAAFNEGLRIDPTDATLLLGLVETRIEQGRVADAQQTLQRLELVAQTTGALPAPLAQRLDEIRTRMASLTAAGG